MNKVMMVLAVFALMPASAEIKVGDSLNIFLKGVPASEKAKVDGAYVVGKSGTIRVPLADVSVAAAGLNGEQLARKIEKVFREAQIYTKPTIEVVTNDVTPPTQAQVSVGGHVKRSGPMPFRPGLTIVQAIQAAGDMTQWGTKKRIFVERGRQRIVLDLRKGEHRNFKLLADDTVTVDQRGPFDGE